MKESDSNTIINSLTSTVWMDDGILKCVYRDGTVIDLETEKENVHDRLLLSNNTPQLIFVDARNVLYWTWDAKKYCLSKEATSLIKAAAVVMNSQILITSWQCATKFFYLKIPTRLFKTPKEALEVAGAV